ncbi:tripartite tricarboxylate transporter substrate binding protein [Nonomuraea insulae]|uniref:Tripartite tricarboxylate transporter substrate binding protein n=1 Tax=Nonomuraea insulae TaxID=1616787 RepID=A0ABW1CZK2_9ACTN
MSSTRAQTPTLSRRTALLSVSGLILLAGCAGVQGGVQDGGQAAGKGFPSKAIQFTVPFPPGGSSDAIGRAVAKGMADPIGKPVVVVNKPGAAGALGAQEVRSMTADGYNLVMLASSLFTVTPLAIPDGTAPALEDFTIIKGLTVEPIVLFARADGPYQSIKDVLALKGSGKRVTYSTTGAGTTSQFAQKLLLGSLKVNASEVPFEGGAPAVAAVLGEQVDLGANHPKEVIEQVKAGNLRILGIFSPERSSLLPDVPTLKESGVDIVVEQRRFLGAPKGLADDVLTKLRAAVDDAQRDPAYGTFLTGNYIDRNEIDAATMANDLAAAKRTYAAQIGTFGVDFSKGQ